MTLGSTVGNAAGVRAWRNAIFVIFAACGIGMATFAARIPAISLQLNLSTAEVGILLSGGAIGSIAGLMASGHLVSAFGARRVMVTSLTAAAVALAAASFGIVLFHSFGIAYGAFIVLGASMGTCDVAMNVSGAANERASGRSVMPVFHAFFSIGTIAGAGLGALAEALRVPLDLHVSVVAVIMIAAAIASAPFVLPEVDAATDDPLATTVPAGWRARLAIWREPRTLVIGVIVLGFAFTEGSANDWLSYGMVHGHGTTKTVGAVVFAIFVAAMTVGRLAGVRLLDRFGRVPVLRATAVLAALGLVILIFVPVFWVDVVGVVCWGIGASLGFPVGMSAAADDPRKAAGTVSTVATIGYLAFLVGPPSIGFLGNQFGILHGLLLVLILVGLAGAVAGAARERKATPKVL